MARQGIVTDNIAKILHDYPQALNDDMLLISLYWKLYDNVYKVDDIVNATSPETITRIKRRYLKRDIDA